MTRWLTGEKYEGWSDEEIAHAQAVLAVEALLRGLLPPNIPVSRAEIGFTLNALKDFFSGSSLAEFPASVTRENINR